MGSRTIYLHKLLAGRHMAGLRLVIIDIVSGVDALLRGFLGPDLFADEIAKPRETAVRIA